MNSWVKTIVLNGLIVCNIMFWDQVNFRTVFKCVPIRVMLMPGYRKILARALSI